MLDAPDAPAASLRDRYSARFFTPSFFSILPATLLFSIITGFAYGIANFHIRYVELRMLLCVATGIAIGLIVNQLVDRSRIRHMGALAVVGILAGVAAHYAAFVGWFLAVSGWSVVIWQPAQVIESIRWVMAIEDQYAPDTDAGLMVLVDLVVEGLTIVGISIYGALFNRSDRPFCETCGHWLGPMSLVGPFEPVANPEVFRAHIERGEFTVLNQIQPLADPDSGFFAQIELHDCPNCDTTSVMTVRNIQVGVDQWGVVASDSQSIVDRLMIDRASGVLIRQVMPSDDALPASTDNGAESI